MNTEPIANRCPKCQAPLPANAPQGLCVKCLLAAVSTPTEAGQPADRKPPPPIATVAASFPQLEILELIGHGGMGVVYKARQPNLDRLVALKLLPQSLAADAAFAERFNREARVLARLNHPNIVTVYDFGQSGGFFFLLMELVDGVNLRQAMQAGRFTPQQAMMLVPKICEALQFAHDEGILHRDIKPENILLDTRGRVKIADFGIAKLVGEAREKVTLTGSGLAVGTPHYMAPEQLEHPQDVDQRADIYSLGVVFYEMLTGELPIGRFAPPSQKSSVDARVDEVVFHALEKEREKRFRSAGEVKTSVEAITSNPAPAHPSPPCPSPGPTIRERRMPCYISTPEHLSTFTGRFVWIYTGKGELRLDAENLTFVSNWQSTVIPLREIRELGIGHYSRLAKPLRLDYLAVSFDQAGQRRTLLFTSTSASSIIQIPWEANERVAECFQAVREAVIARTGTPPAGPATPVPPPASFASGLREALQLVLPVCVLSTVIAGLVALLRHASGGTSSSSNQGIDAWFPSGETIMIVSGMALVLGLIGWATSKRKQLRTINNTVGAPLSSSPMGTAVLPAHRTTCYFNTPARMRDCFPSAAARIFTCKGELALDEESLTFTSTWRTVITIPLKDIEDLSVGQFQMWTTPWVMKYARINFLSVTFRQQGQLQTVHLTPVEPGATTAGQINDCVGSWFDRVRQAAIARAGSAPHCSEPESLTITAQKAWGRIGWPLYILFMLVWFGSWFVLPSVTGFRAPQPVWTILAIVTGLLAAATLFSAAGFMKADRALKRGDLDAVTSDDPPSPEPAGADTGRSPGTRWLNVSYLGLAVAALVLVLLAGWWSFSHSPAPPSGETSGDSSTRAGMAGTPEPESRFVLYTMPPQGTNAPGVLRWKFKCLVPAHHLARVLFVFWTNGVPTVHKGFSTYVKVGNASIDNDFYLSCERIAAAASQTQTNLVLWSVGLRAGGGGLVLPFPGQPAYLLMKTPAHMTVRSGHQGILRLVDYVGQDGQPTYGQSGVELRIFLEPIKYAPVRTDPFETEGPNYVAGLGPGWTTDEALEAIKQWPVDQ